MAQILVDNDNNITLQAYTLAATGAAVTDALPSATLYLDDGTGRLPTGPLSLTSMPGAANIPMAYYSQTGIYAGLLPGTVLLTPGSWYWVKVTFSNYNDVFADWFQAAVRSSTTG
jgi:hypothetical protein